jgi:hypothetical protein
VITNKGKLRQIVAAFQSGDRFLCKLSNCCRLATAAINNKRHLGESGAIEFGH